MHPDIPVITVPSSKLSSDSGEFSPTNFPNPASTVFNPAVFTRTDGSPVLPGTLTENFKDLTRQLEMPPLNFHGLRHAFATLALQAGMNPKVVSEALGHSSVTITLDTYSHVLPNMRDELAIAVENLLKRS